MVGFCGFCTIEGYVNGEFEEKSEKLKFSIQNSYWERNSLFAMVPLLAPIAQLVEHLASNHEVMSSSLTWGSFLFYARLYTVIVHCVGTYLYEKPLTKFYNLLMSCWHDDCYWHETWSSNALYVGFWCQAIHKKF